MPWTDWLLLAAAVLLPGINAVTLWRRRRR